MCIELAAESQVTEVVFLVFACFLLVCLIKGIRAGTYISITVGLNRWKLGKARWRTVVHEPWEFRAFSRSTLSSVYGCSTRNKAFRESFPC